MLFRIIRSVGIRVGNAGVLGLIGDDVLYLLVLFGLTGLSGITLFFSWGQSSSVPSFLVNLIFLAGLWVSGIL